MTGPVRCGRIAVPRWDLIPSSTCVAAREARLVNSRSWWSLRSAAIGYWVSQHVAGQGITPTAVALATDHCFGVLGLHRVEVNIRPENAPSLRVVEKLGFRDEGLRERYLHIQGAWCDHRTFALTTEDVPQGLLARWHARRPSGV